MQGLKKVPVLHKGANPMSCCKAMQSTEGERCGELERDDSVLRMRGTTREKGAVLSLAGAQQYQPKVFTQ